MGQSLGSFFILRSAAVADVVNASQLRNISRPLFHWRSVSICKPLCPHTDARALVLCLCPDCLYLCMGHTHLLNPESCLKISCECVSERVYVCVPVLKFSQYKGRTFSKAFGFLASTLELHDFVKDQQGF